MAISTRQVILIKYIYTLWGQKHVSSACYILSDEDIQAAMPDCNAPSTRDLNIWLCGRQADLSGIGVRVGVANIFGSINR